MGGQKEGGLLLGRRETYKGGQSKRGSKWRKDEDKGAHSHFDKDYKLLQTAGKFVSFYIRHFLVFTTAKQYTLVLRVKEHKVYQYSMGLLLCFQCS